MASDTHWRNTASCVRVHGGRWSRNSATLWGGGGRTHRKRQEERRGVTHQRLVLLPIRDGLCVLTGNARISNEVHFKG